MARPLKKDAYDADPRDLGRYRLHGEIASGGMATVHFGRQVGTGGFSKTVAIKRLHPQFGKMPEFVQMFLAEARLAARIRHPNIVQPLDVLTVDDEIFLVMEYVEGDSLSRLMRATLARKERVPVPIAMSIICGMLHGLQAAHEAKSDRGEPLELVHRDVSPQNVLVGIDGVPRVIDFGIAKAADSVQFTRDGELKGKLSYMAPEQLNGHRCTRRSDIYAASVVLWEVITGQRLFDADYQSAILQNILHRPVDPPSDVVHDLPKALDRIVLKGLSRDPSDRYATARDMALALEESVPLATQSSVGSWVEVVAAKPLAQRAARVAEIESVPSAGPSDDLSEEIVSEMLVQMRSEGLPPSRPTQPSSGDRRRNSQVPGYDRGQLPFATTERADTLPLPPERGARGRASTPPPPPVVPPPVPPAAPPSSRSRQAANDRADTSVLSVRSAPTNALPTTLQSGMPFPPPAPPSPSSGDRPPPPTIQVYENQAGAPQWPVAGIAPSVTGATVIVQPAKRSQGFGMVLFLLFLIAGVAGFFIVLPEFLKRGYISGAARTYGVTLTIESVQVSLRQIRLVGVNGTVHEIPGASVRCESVDLPLAGFTPTEMTAHDVVLTLDGAYPVLADALTRWNHAHVRGPDGDVGLRSVMLDSGHLIWTRAFGEQTNIEIENMTGTVERTEGRPLGDDYHLSAPLAVLSTAAGKIGPWQLKVETTNRLVRATVAFDPSGVTRAQSVVTVKDGTVSSILTTIPRTPLNQLGIAALGIRQDQPVFAEGDAQYAISAGGHVEGHVRLTVTGARVNGSFTPSQADVDLHFEGDPKLPIEFGESLITVGSFRARPTGGVTFGDGFVRAELAWRGGTIHCPGGGDQTIASTLRFDSHNLDASSWSVGGSRCPHPGP
jgi:serine/threonine protein kinase